MLPHLAPNSVWADLFVLSSKSWCDRCDRCVLLFFVCLLPTSGRGLPRTLEVEFFIFLGWSRA